MIRLEQVSKIFDNTIAVDDFSLEVTRGEVCVLIGPSGCGKTTLLRMINRLIEPTSGEILINGEDTSRIKPEKLRLSTGYAIQSVGLFPHMTVSANIAVVPGLLHWDKKRINTRVRELLELVGLNPDEHAGKYPVELSGGEAQRVGVARALAADPPTLLMDEPFGAVDPLTRERLQAQFVLIQKKLKKTVILVTHDLDEAIRLADRIAIMKDGKLVQYDTPEEILAKPANKFVHDFAGADRALKRLSRIKLDRFVRPAPSIRFDAPTKDAKKEIGDKSYIWVVNELGQPVGWLDQTDLLESSLVQDVIVSLKTEDVSLPTTATLRDALSRMLEQGVRSLAIVDEKGRFIGEVTLSEVESATSEAVIYDAQKSD